MGFMAGEIPVIRLWPSLLLSSKSDLFIYKSFECISQSIYE